MKYNISGVKTSLFLGSSVLVCMVITFLYHSLYLDLSNTTIINYIIFSVVNLFINGFTLILIIFFIISLLEIRDTLLRIRYNHKDILSISDFCSRVKNSYGFYRRRNNELDLQYGKSEVDFIIDFKYEDLLITHTPIYTKVIYKPAGYVLLHFGAYGKVFLNMDEANKYIETGEYFFHGKQDHLVTETIY